MLCHPGWSAVVQSRLTATSASWVLLPQPPKYLGLQAPATMMANFFAFLAEIGFHHIGQAGLKLLTSGNLPTLASQSAEITGVSHHTQPIHSFFIHQTFWRTPKQIIKKTHFFLLRSSQLKHLCIEGQINKDIL